MAVNYDLEQTGAEVQNRINQVPENESDINDIKELIPEEASSANQLTDKEYVDAADAHLQQQIDTIIGGNASVAISVRHDGANITNIFANTDYELTIAATASITASAITIKKNGTTIKSGANTTSISETDTVNIEGGASVAYRADATMNGVAKSASKNVNAYDKVYWGMGTENDYSTVETDSTVRTGIAGTYNFTYAAATPYVYILVPTTMADLTKAEMGAGGMGEYNLEKITDEGTIEDNPGVTYRVWRGVAAITEDIQLIIS